MEPIVINGGTIYIGQGYATGGGQHLRLNPDTGAVRKAVVENDMVAIKAVQSTDERRYVLGLAYPAMRVDKALAADGFRDFVSLEVLEETAWAWLHKSRGVNLLHQSNTDGHAEVVESYIWRADPWVIKAADGSEVTILKGDWLMGCRFDEHAWGLVKSGKLNGWSPEGGAKRTIPSVERLKELRR